VGEAVVEDCAGGVAGDGDGATGDWMLTTAGALRDGAAVGGEFTCEKVARAGTESLVLGTEGVAVCLGKERGAIAEGAFVAAIETEVAAESAAGADRLRGRYEGGARAAADGPISSGEDFAGEERKVESREGEVGGFKYG
jgi:hypothetical protein